MRKISTINDGWRFIKRSLSPAEAATADGEAIDLPYSWNGTDGQDGGNDYVRGAFWFVKRFKAPPAEAGPRQDAWPAPRRNGSAAPFPSVPGKQPQARAQRDPDPATVSHQQEKPATRFSSCLVAKRFPHGSALKISN